MIMMDDMRDEYIAVDTHIMGNGMIDFEEFRDKASCITS